MKKRGTALLWLLPLLPLFFFGAGLLTAEVATRAARFVAPKPTGLFDAVKLEQNDAIFSMISAGADPGVAVVLTEPLYYWGPGAKTSPLLVAIAHGDRTRAAFLLQHTRRLSEPPNDQALCIAARFGHSSLAEFLISKGARAVPKGGCGEIQYPEDIAARYGSGRLSGKLRRYRLETR
jgi:hypothetical protein